MAMVIIVIAYEQSRHSLASSTLKTQSLSQSTLNQLANSNSTIGSNQYVLNVESSAIFAGQVILKQSLEIAGNLQVGGTAAFNNITVAGTGQFNQATVNNNLTVGGNSAVQGSSTIAKSLQVSGSGSFGGALSAPQITTSTLQLSGDLVLQHHISVSGPAPSRSNGPALGSGGSASISGSDTAGSININTGGSPTVGCFVTINFTTAYNATPHVLVTPIGSSAGGLSYYVNRSTTSFSICDATTPPSGSSFGFDYFVID
jgi:cytoskeletal protein CcmA (bactofilin family)